MTIKHLPEGIDYENLYIGERSIFPDENKRSYINKAMYYKPSHSRKFVQLDLTTVSGRYVVSNIIHGSFLPDRYSKFPKNKLTKGLLSALKMLESMYD